MNIALVNELKRVYGAMGIEVWDVIEAAKPKPFGYMPFYPGLGLGGHSIPIDPLLPYLEGAGVWHRHALYRAWRPVNSSMAQHVVNEPARILDLSSSARGLTRARILVLAVAQKKNVDDTRESPALRLMEMLEAGGAEVRLYGPFVSVIPETREHKSLADWKSEVWDPVQLGTQDAILIAADHDDVDYVALAFMPN